MRWYEKFNTEPKLKRGNKSVKIFNRVTSSCQKIGVMTIYNYFKFQNNIPNALGVKLGSTNNLTRS